MKTSFLLFFLLLSCSLFAQEGNKNFDIRFGVGTSLMGSGDMITVVFENEINYKISPYFTTAMAVNYGRSNRGVYLTSSFLQGNLNLFISPFKNTRKNDFRLGGGISLMNVSDVRLTSAEYNAVGDLIDADYTFNERSSYGYNFILEDTYTIKEKFLLGLKLFTQPYFSRDINSGIVLKLGVKL